MFNVLIDCHFVFHNAGPLYILISNAQDSQFHDCEDASLPHLTLPHTYTPAPFLWQACINYLWLGEHQGKSRTNEALSVFFEQ